MDFSAERDCFLSDGTRVAFLNGNAGNVNVANARHRALGGRYSAEGIRNNFV